MGSNPMAVTPPTQWTPDQLTRIPYWLFQREDVYAREQQRIFLR